MMPKPPQPTSWSRLTPHAGEALLVQEPAEVIRVLHGFGILNGPLEAVRDGRRRRWRLRYVLAGDEEPLWVTDPTR
jgi:hypothetical protein